MGDHDRVSRLVPVPERQASVVDPGVTLEKEILGAEQGRDPENCFVIHHDRGDHGLFGGDVVWWQLLENHGVRLTTWLNRSSVIL